MSSWKDKHWWDTNSPKSPILQFNDNWSKFMANMKELWDKYQAGEFTGGGNGEPITPITFYFNTYDVDGKEWSTNPQNMVNGNIITYASETLSNTQLLTSNTCSAISDTVPTKIELRIHAYYSGSIGDIALKPIFIGGNGDNHSTSITTIPKWTEWVDITNDINAPSTWGWDDIQALNCEVISITHLATVFCSKVEIKVTYISE